MAGEPVRTTTLRNYFKESTGLRVSAGASEKLVGLLTVQLEQIAQRSKELAMSEDRNTLLDRDIEGAFDGWLKDAGPTLLTSRALLTTINGMSNETLTEVIQLLQAQLNR